VCEYRAFPCSKGCGKIIAAKHLNVHECSHQKRRAKALAAITAAATTATTSTTTEAESSSNVTDNNGNPTTKRQKITASEPPVPTPKKVSP
jgi:hypothetical protein